MPTYVTLANFTEQGIRAIKESPARQAQFEQAVQQAGGRVHGIYTTLGQYDAVAIFEAPDDEAAARLLLSLGSRGNVRTQTLRAYTREEFAKLVQSL